MEIRVSDGAIVFGMCEIVWIYLKIYYETNFAPLAPLQLNMHDIELRLVKVAKKKYKS